jgi:hypothetical protein
MRQSLLRYAARPDADRWRWSVIDRECSSYAHAEGRWLTGLTRQGALDWATRLNGNAERVRDCRTR